MDLFMRAIVLTAMILALPVHAMAATAAVADKPVARIDSLIATATGGRITIQAKGAVTGGGWTHIALKPIKSALPADAHTMVVEFVGVPPSSSEAVIRGLLPVAANLTLKGRKGVVAVRAVSDANEITTQILK
jgi:hypothetical protein